MTNEIKILPLPLPEYTIVHQPNYNAIGKKIDGVIEENFSGKNVAIRALGLQDHPGKTMEELVDIIVKTGTDKYNPKHKGVGHEEFAAYDADFQASPLTVPVKGEGADIIKKFYENVLLDRGYRVRVDLLLIYDLHQLDRAKKIDVSKPDIPERLLRYLFKFKYPHNKPGALLGIIKLLK